MRAVLEWGDCPDLTKSKHSLQQTKAKFQNYQWQQLSQSFRSDLLCHIQSILAQWLKILNCVWQRLMDTKAYKLAEVMGENEGFGQVHRDKLNWPYNNCSSYKIINPFPTFSTSSWNCDMLHSIIAKNRKKIHFLSLRAFHFYCLTAALAQQSEAPSLFCRPH